MHVLLFHETKQIRENNHARAQAAQRAFIADWRRLQGPPAGPQGNHPGYKILNHSHTHRLQCMQYMLTLGFVSNLMNISCFKTNVSIYQYIQNPRIVRDIRGHSRNRNKGTLPEWLSASASSMAWVFWPAIFVGILCFLSMSICILFQRTVFLFDF